MRTTYSSTNTTPYKKGPVFLTTVVTTLLIGVVASIGDNEYFCGKSTDNCKGFSGHPSNSSSCCPQGVNTPYDEKGYNCYVYCIENEDKGFGPCGPSDSPKYRCHNADLGLVAMDEYLGNCSGTNKCQAMLKKASGQMYNASGSYIDPISCY
jgi:hypothetical protein